MNKQQLAREIEFELDQLRRSAETAAQLTAVSPDQRRPWDAAAAAKYIADLFNGFENLCKRRCRYLALPIPEGPQSHTQILDEFLSVDELGGTLPEEFSFRLKKYLRFRHRFMHGYGFEVNWEIVEEPLRLISETVEQLAKTWKRWLDTLLAEQD